MKRNGKISSELLIAISIIAILIGLLIGLNFNRLSIKDLVSGKTHNKNLMPKNDAIDKTLVFRNTYWGMPVEDVMMSEKRAKFYSKNGRVISYTSTFDDDYHALISYVFVADKLVRARYVIVDADAHNEARMLFKAFYAPISEKYGEGTVDMIWTNDRYKGNDSMAERAIEIGDLTVKSVWENKTTHVTEIVTLVYGSVTLIVEYYSLKYHAADKKFLKEEK